MAEKRMIAPLQERAMNPENDRRLADAAEIPPVATTRRAAAGVGRVRVDCAGAAGTAIFLPRRLVQRMNRAMIFSDAQTVARKTVQTPQSVCGRESSWL